jgi:hypothetical protein
MVEHKPNLEELTHKHFDPHEYNIAMRVFGELEPNKKQFLDYHVHIVEHNPKQNMKEQSLDQLKQYLESHYLNLGDTIFSMYVNIYHCLSQIYFRNGTKGSN